MPAATSSGGLPLYLLGEYRLDGAGEARKAKFKLTLRRGQADIDVRQGQDVAPADMPRLVRRTASEMFSKALGQATRPPDGKTEAEQLAQRHGFTPGWATGKRPWR